MLGRKYLYTEYHNILTADKAKICCWMVSSSLLSTHGGTAASKKVFNSKEEKRKTDYKGYTAIVLWKNENVPHNHFSNLLMSFKYNHSLQFPDLNVWSLCMYAFCKKKKKLLELGSGDTGQHLDGVMKINVTNEGEMAIVGPQIWYPEDTSLM